MKAYDKEPLSLEDQIQLLRDRNLSVSDHERAKHFLGYANYYRVSAYFLPFQDTKDKFRDGIDFEDIRRLYHFDRILRNLVWEALSAAEIQFRSRIAYHLCMTLKDQFPQYDEKNFSLDGWARWKRRLANIEQSFYDSKEDFIQHFKNNYSDFPELPIWAFTEVITFGDLSFLFNSLKRMFKKDIARHYAVKDVVLGSWLHSLSVTRNICAHHARLWNKKLNVRPQIPKNLQNWNDVDNENLFCILLILTWLLKNCQGTDFLIPEWQRKIEAHLDFQNRNVFNLLNQMGMKPNWKTHPIWLL